MRKIISDNVQGIVEPNGDKNIIFDIGIYDIDRLIAMLQFCRVFGEDVKIALEKNGSLNAILVRPYKCDGDGWYALAPKIETD